MIDANLNAPEYPTTQQGMSNFQEDLHLVIRFGFHANHERLLVRLADMSGKRREWSKRYCEFVETDLAE